MSSHIYPWAQQPYTVVLRLLNTSHGDGCGACSIHRIYRATGAQQMRMALRCMVPATLSIPPPSPTQSHVRVDVRSRSAGQAIITFEKGCTRGAQLDGRSMHETRPLGWVSGERWDFLQLLSKRPKGGE